MNSIDSLQKIYLMKFFFKCLSLETEKSKMWEYLLRCFVLEFLHVVSSKIYWLCQCLRQHLWSEMLNFCYYCLFGKDMYIFDLTFEYSCAQQMYLKFIIISGFFLFVFFSMFYLNREL